MGRHFKNNATGGGCSERVTTKRLKKPVAALVALVATCVVAVSAYATVPAVRNAVDTVRDNLVAAVTGSNAAQTRAVSGAEKTVDPDTTNAWSSIAASSTSTENIGRIWTDKSVFSDDYGFSGALEGTSVVKGTDSDFLVGLSAISSTSNLKSVVTNITPLDIVLVLDVSGSMDDPIGEIETTTYQEVYDGLYSGLDTWRTYYVRSGNDYIAVTWEGNYYNGSWQDREGNEYEPRTSRNDNNRNHVQFYQQITASESAGSKMQALKDAANGFAETFATMNDSIADPNDRHRISIVKFASNENNSVGNDTYWDNYYDYRPNYTQVVSDLNSYTTENVSALTNTINSLEGEGATQANYGFHQAQRVFNGDGSLTGARSDAQKVVIFFTDGNPTNYQNFSDSIAGQAINYAYDMKQAGALVYTIGVFEDANPSDTNGNFNRYMNAVSSNYPEAECENRWGQQSDSFNDLNLGDKVQGEDGEEAPQYYYSATNSVGLEQVFKDITESLPINQGSGSPIEDHEGAAGTPGYLTFTDTLGSFMEVTGVGADNNKMYLAFADGLHEGTPNEDGTEWTFSGTVNEGNGVNTAYPKGADLSEIKVTVNKSGELATGDTITVKIPASLIPMRNYDVDTDNGTMTVSDTYPVRLFYGVSVKDGVIDALNNPQDANHDAVLARASADGKTIDFYSNNFVKGADEGSTEASFTPSDGNKFYYYPVNTQLFIDENCTQPATRYNIGDYSRLYYEDSYWQLTGNGNEAEEVPANGSITRSGNDWNVTYQGNNAYIAANTPRADRPATLVSNKEGNATGTASTVLTPTWNGASVSQKLGNNGKLSVDAPGDLRIDKNVDWGNASSETQADKNSFEFTVHLYTVAEDGTQTNLTNQYDYAVYGTGETPVSTGTISDNGEITLEGGQYVVISDLPNGAQYTVTEQAANQNGFATTDNSTGENANTTNGVVEGAIVGGSQQTAEFTNTYHATEVTLEGANQLVKVQKNLTGREWQDTDEFRFTMFPEGSAPAPESTDAVVVDDEDAAADYTVNLSNITFENPGTFTYVIGEDNDTNTIAGIDYSNETYAVTITVVDNGTGKLEIQSVQFTQRADVDGNEPAEQPEITDNTVVFTNNYDATEATTNLNGTKDYTDNSGDNPNAPNKFTFELKAIGGYATEGGSADNPTIGAADVPMPEGADTNTHTITIGNNGTNPDGFAFQTIKYNGTHLNNTYIYEIREVIPQGATENGDGTWSLNGMTYDGTVHTVTVEITDEPNEQGEGMHIVATPSMKPADVEFTNVYDPEDYTLEGNEVIHGTKVLQGREIGDNETFYFELKQTDGPETVLTDPEVKTVTKDGSMDFAFSELTFSKVGEYTFTVNEVADDQGTETTDGSGMTYSKNVAKVTIKVKDGGNGALVLDGPVVYENQGSNETGKAVFTNVYEAEMKYGAEGKGGINVTKQLLDRPMTAGEFDFTITGEGEAAGLTTDADKNFQNTGAAADQTITMAKLQSLTFDETDAGKTYTFIVDETEPTEGEGLAGVAYDKSQYKVEIEVVDNGNGTMHAVTTVTQTMDKDGNEIADGGKVVVDHANSDANGYTVPTFGFVNDYNPNSVDMGEDAENALQVTKKVIGAPSAADYTFTLTAQDTAEGPVANIKGLDENHQTTETISGTIAAGETQTLSFDTLTFTEPGTYTFTVKENQPAADDGWTFDTTPRTITVEVTDVNPDYEPGGDALQYDGNLYIGDVTGNNPTIENEYDHGTVTIGGDTSTPVEVKKAVIGWTTEADFNFTLAPADYNEEDPESVEHWSAVEADESAAKAGITDGFTATDDLGADNAKTAKFGEITFTEPGTYTFNVTEDGAADFNKQSADERAGWTYDDSTYQIVVEVSETNADDEYDGKLHATITSDPVTFTNKYEAGTATVEGGEATFAGTKTIDGRGWLDNETFGFELTKGDVSEGASWDNVTYLPVNADEDTEPVAFESATATANEQNDKNGTFWFAGTYLFSEPGTYTFNVTETQHNGNALPKKDAEPVNGMTYDRHVGTITVEVTDNGSGTLQTKVTPGTGDASVNFVNTFEGEPYTFGLEADEMLSGHKTVEDNVGSFQMADGQFTFVMRAQAEGNPMPNDLTVETDTNGYKVVSVTNKNTDAQAYTADYSFGSITFDHDDLAGVTDDDNDGKISKAFQYNVYENETDMPAGVSAVNPGRTYTVTITVTEDLATGEITAEGEAVLVNSGDTENDPATLGSLDFVNKYDAGTITGGIQIYKTLSGRKWQKGDTFTFDVTMKADGVAKDDLPEFNFDNLAGTVDDYTEADGELSYNITINPSQSATGNSYAFGTGVPTYTHEGTYVYTITERDSTVAGVTKDSSTYVVTVVIEDVVENGEHVLNRTATITRDGEPYENTGRVDFTNTYKAEGKLDGDTALKFQKTFTGRENDAWLDYDSFVIEMNCEPGSSAPMPQGSNGDLYQRIVHSSDAEGSTATVNVPAITYTEKDAGKTYTYTVVEKPKNEYGQREYGITYSQAAYEIKVTVEDNGNGTLEIEPVITQVKNDKGEEVSNVMDVAAFNNTYKVNEDTKTVDRVDEGVKTDVDGKLVGVGDTLEYTIHWVNDAINENGVAQDATVTVVDTLPAGVTLDQDSIGEGVYDSDAGTITWTFDAKAAQEGDITYSVTVNDEALQIDELTNSATIALNDNDPKATVETTVHVPQKSVENDREDAADGDLKVGDTLTYTIEYTNDTDEPATITVTDPVPAGLTVTQNDIQDGGTLADGTITWVIENVPAGQSGEVHFSGVVNETALTEGADNQATIQVGEDGPVIKTNTVPGTLKTGTMSITKTVVVDEAEGTEIDTSKLFEFTVNLTDTKNNALTGTYAIEGAFDKDGNALTSVADGDKVYLHHGDSATVEGLPAGTKVKVTETVPEGYKADKAERTGAILADADTLFAFTNTYSTDPGTVSEGTESAFNLTKQLTGRDENNSWAVDDEFSFTLTPGTATDLKGNPVEDLTVPMPADSADGIKKVTVGADKAGENGVAPIDFGAISYERTGIYTYTVQETGADGDLGTGGSAEGITYDGRTVTITVNVTDNGTGGLVAAVAKTGEAETASFVNTYNSKVTYDANGVGGLDVTKVLNNRDMTAGQFTFTVKAKGDAAEKIGGTEIQMTSSASTAGTAASVANNPFDGITFDRNDSGVDFVYTIVEDQTDGDGYICDTSTYTVTITPTDNGDGTMSVTTVVADSDGEHNVTVEDATADDPQVATVPFENTYDAGDVTLGAEGDATIVATKVLENDDIANYEGDFTFKVTSGDTVVATGSNNADGSITFGTITYTSENLYAAAHTQGGSDEVGTASLDTTGDKDVYTFVYNVSEDTPSAAGVSYTSGNGSVTITVTDDRAGKLSIDVDYGSDAESLEFVNTYGTSDAAEVTLDGNKTLTGKDGAIAPELKDGMFEFTITGEDGAPMPETTTVSNEGSAINFGPIKYTMENVFGTDADAEATVTEDKTTEQVDEAVETEVAEVEGETAETEATEVETTDEAATESETTDEVVAGESAPAEDEGIELYTKDRTKTFEYTISETNAGKTIDGIKYDGTSKTVKVTVTDNGDGTVSAAVTPAEGADENMDFTFDNIYTVEEESSTPTGEGALTFTKVWDRQGGTRELAAGDFTFQLVSAADPETVYTATNDADGNVAFEAITFDHEDDYVYTLSEVVPEGATPVDGGYEKDGVLYLNTSYTVTAHVTDDHDGTLSVEWTMTDADGADVTTATFVNTYFVEGTSVTFGAAKALEGRAVKDGEFTFELRDAEGNVLGTATNDETGQIVFADAVQSFGNVGEYDFVIAEVLPEDDDAATEGIQKDGVTYDETTYTAHVVVSDDNKGKLYVSELTYNGEAALPTFKNSYEEPKEPVTPEEPEKPAKPEENIPQTGDNTIAMVGGCALAAMALIGGGIFLRRRNSDQQ